MFAPDLDGKERFTRLAINESRNCAMCDVKLSGLKDMCDLRRSYNRSRSRDSCAIAVGRAWRSSSEVVSAAIVVLVLTPLLDCSSGAPFLLILPLKTI